MREDLETGMDYMIFDVGSFGWLYKCNVSESPFSSSMIPLHPCLVFTELDQET